MSGPSLGFFLLIENICWPRTGPFGSVYWVITMDLFKTGCCCCQTFCCASDLLRELLPFSFNFQRSFVSWNYFAQFKSRKYHQAIHYKIRRTLSLWLTAGVQWRVRFPICPKFQSLNFLLSRSWEGESEGQLKGKYFSFFEPNFVWSLCGKASAADIWMEYFNILHPHSKHFSNIIKIF